MPTDPSASPLPLSDPWAPMAEKRVNAYNEHLARIEAFRVQHIADNPHLVAYNPGGPKISSLALAAKNARILLKQAFPGVKFQVTTDSGSMYSDVIVKWTDWEDAPRIADQEVKDLLKAFVTRTYIPGSDNQYDYDTDESREGFREAFGKTQSTSPQRRSPPDPGTEEHRKHEAEVLKATMKNLPQAAAIENTKKVRRRL